MRTLILDYHAKIREALEQYERQEQDLNQKIAREKDPRRRLFWEDRLRELKRRKDHVYNIATFLWRFSAHWV
jgi:hypothetical protein